MVTRRSLLKGAAALSVAATARGAFDPRAAAAQQAALPCASSTTPTATPTPTCGWRSWARTSPPARRRAGRANDGVTGPVAAVLAAALNRSTLAASADQPVADPASYYRRPVTNHYARVLHEQAADGRAYGFAFDDVADHASYVQDTAPTSLTLTLTPFQ